MNCKFVKNATKKKNLTAENVPLKRLDDLIIIDYSYRAGKKIINYKLIPEFAAMRLIFHIELNISQGFLFYFVTNEISHTHTHSTGYVDEIKKKKDRIKVIILDDRFPKQKNLDRRNNINKRTKN